MFSYYGSKSRIIKKYPAPEFDIIIEPFAGSARYALLHGENRHVVLNDLYPVIAEIWKYLIKATPKQIDALPNLQAGESLKNFEMSDVERDLMGFFVNMGVSTPHYIYSKWASGNDNIGRSKRLAKQFLPLIRQWKISCKSYLELENIEATWFIDPPYQHGGKRYKVHDIDYDILAAWSRSRKGQVIVCENTPANWLPFKPLVQMTGQRTRTTELIWTNTK